MSLRKPLVEIVTPPAGDAGPVDSARRSIGTERAGLEALAAALDNGLAAPFSEAVAMIRQCRGRIAVSGVGKSGHIGRKIAATLASTGTPAFFVHPAEANHGDLGMITEDDIVLALSWSGETAELRGLVEYSRRFGISLISITATLDSSLARESSLVLLMPRITEACPHGLAPTTSALVQLALGDALAIALLEGRGFTAERFHAFHPGGRLGASLKVVRDIMHKREAVPLVGEATLMSDAILVISEKGFGCVGIVDTEGALVGIVTDGDLRRHMSQDLLSRPVAEIMTRSPKSVAADTLVGEALAMMNMTNPPFMALFVAEGQKPVGIVHMHDLLRIGVV